KGAILEQLSVPVLATGPLRGIVVVSNVRSVRRSSPTKTMFTHHRQHRIEAFGAIRAEPALEIFGGEQRAGRLNQHDGVEIMLFGELQHCRLRARCVFGGVSPSPDDLQLGRLQCARCVRDNIRVGCDVDDVDVITGDGRLRAPQQQRLSREPANVLAWNRLRSTPGRDEGDRLTARYESHLICSLLSLLRCTSSTGNTPVALASRARATLRTSRHNRRRPSGSRLAAWS